MIYFLMRMDRASASRNGLVKQCTVGFVSRAFGSCLRLPLQANWGRG